MANILIVHEHIPLRAALLDYVRLSGHVGVEAADLDQARIRAGSTACGVVVIGLGEGDRAESKVRFVQSEWPMAKVAVLRSTTDLFDVFDAIKHSGPEAHRGAALAADGEGDAAHLPHAGAHRASDPSEEPVAVDPVTRATFAKAARVAAVNSTVLLTGSSGTGKEVLARYIHRHSLRRACKFVPVNCGCLPETLIETELFGYKKGAFTGAVADRKGLVEEADRGVLFLDEVGDMPLSMQVRLLRFLDSGEVRAVGDTHFKRVDVRVIAATNRNLPDAIRQNQFREDLYFRLSVVSIEIPPLRDRRGDIRALVDQSLCRAAVKFGVAVPRVSDAAMSLLVQYEWPGNIRELQNAVEYALVQKSGEIIRPDDLPLPLGHGRQASIAGDWLDDAQSERERLIVALRRANGNQREAAAELGISRTTLWRRLRQLNIPIDADGMPSEAGTSAVA